MAEEADVLREIVNGTGPVVVVSYKLVKTEDGLLVLLKLYGRGRTWGEALLRHERLFIQVCSDIERWL